MKPFSWVIERIRELAANDQARKAECRYFDAEAKPDCIIGHVLHELGAKNDDSDLINRDGEYAGRAWTQAEYILWDVLGVHEGTKAESDWVQAVQSMQDSGANWGAAVAHADKFKLVPA